MVLDFLAAHATLAYELIGVFAVLAIVVTVAGILIARFEKMSIEDGIYYAFITAFTVGLGDIAPQSRASKLITVLLALLGLILIGILVATAVHALDAALKAS